MPVTERRVMRAADWPHPVVCRDCGRPIKDGDEYSEDLVGFENSAPVVEIVCTKCGELPY